MDTVGHYSFLKLNGSDAMLRWYFESVDNLRITVQS